MNRFNFAKLWRVIRNATACLGLAMFIGGVAWHDVPIAVALCGLLLSGGSVLGMILAGRS